MNQPDAPGIDNPGNNFQNTDMPLRPFVSPSRSVTEAMRPE
jgi:hypothetical protein